MSKNIKIPTIILAVLILATALIAPAQPLSATPCKDLFVIFARGSGEGSNSQNYLAFKAALESSLAEHLPSISYHFSELQYPAAAVGINGLGQIATTAGAIISGGDSYSFGESVNQGVTELKSYIRNTSAACPNSRFILGGYSQGAMVLSKAIQENLDPRKILYAATFGDPKLYLPEGARPAAVCRGQTQLSSYRVYVPDCHAYQGILGGFQPYLPHRLWEGKLGTWCNYHDIMCSAKINLGAPFSAHEAYVSDHRYEDAATIIAAKAVTHFTGQTIATTTTPSSNVAFLIDTSSASAELLAKYVDEAGGLAKIVLANGGRVAFYATSTSGTRQLCSFVTCAPSNFPGLIDSLTPTLGQTSLYDSIMQTMNELSWTVGANKQVIAFTNTGVVPGSVTFSQLVARSREIDPVHISTVTSAELISADPNFTRLAEATSGAVYNHSSDFEKLNSAIENLNPEGVIFNSGDFTEVEIANFHHSRAAKNLNLDFETHASKILILVNDTIYGLTSEKTLSITNLDFTRANKIILIPYSASGDRGKSFILELPPSVTPLSPDSGIKIK